MMVYPPPTSILLFAIGFWLTLTTVRTFSKTRRLYRLTERAWQEAKTLFDRRIERLPLLLRSGQRLPILAPLLSTLTEVRNTQQAATTFEERVTAEQELSRQLSHLAIHAESLGILIDPENKEFAEMVTEFQEQEPFLLAARERFNEIAAAWNSHRRPFPANLIAAAQGWPVLPLFRAPDAPRSV